MEKEKTDFDKAFEDYSAINTSLKQAESRCKILEGASEEQRAEEDYDAKLEEWQSKKATLNGEFTAAVIKVLDAIDPEQEVDKVLALPNMEELDPTKDQRQNCIAAIDDSKSRLLAQALDLEKKLPVVDHLDMIFIRKVKDVLRQTEKETA